MRMKGGTTGLHRCRSPETFDGAFQSEARDERFSQMYDDIGLATPQHRASSPCTNLVFERRCPRYSDSRLDPIDVDVMPDVVAAAL